MAKNDQNMDANEEWFTGVTDEKSKVGKLLSKAEMESDAARSETWYTASEIETAKQPIAQERNFLRSLNDSFQRLKRRFYNPNGIVVAEGKIPEGKFVRGPVDSRNAEGVGPTAIASEGPKAGIRE